MSNEERKKGFLDKLWDVFASVKLAVVVFSVISLTSIVGTVLEQNAAPSQNIQILAEMFGQNIAEKLYPVLEAMGFVSMYGSWWFRTFLMIFAMNLLICSLDRLPRIWKLVVDVQKPLKEEQFKRFPVRQEFAIKGSVQEAKDKAVAGLAKLGFRKLSGSEDEGMQYYGQKGPYTRLGVYVTHISILVILAGAVIGYTFGFKGYLNIGEGEIYPFAFARQALPRDLQQERNMILGTLEKTNGDVERAAASLKVDNDRFRSRMRAVGIEPLGFTVECKDFEVDFYGRSDMPKEYRSLLTVHEKGQAMQEMWIEVNKPLRYKGYTFYQSSYGPISDPASLVFKVVTYERSNTSARQKLDLKLNESFTLPGSDITATIAEFSPALNFDQSGRPFTYDEMMNNPAVRLSIKDGESQFNKWILKRYPDTWSYRGSHVIELADIWGAQYTGLQVRKDPGVWIVYLGCLLMAGGLYMAFFMSHRRIWLKLEPSGKGNSVRALIAGTANKNREGFERAIKKIISQLEDGGK